MALSAFLASVHDLGKRIQGDIKLLQLWPHRIKHRSGRLEEVAKVGAYHNS